MDELLTTVGRLSSQFGPLTRLFDRIVAWAVPQTMAAACTGYACQLGCKTLSNVCSTHDHLPSEGWFYSDTQADCSRGQLNGCFAWDGNCCFS